MRVLRDILFDNPVIDPGKLALVYRDRRLSYADLRERVCRAGNALVGAGIGCGDRVAMLLENSNEFVELFLAITGIGAIAVPLNYRLSPEEHAAILSDADPVLMFAAAPYAASVAAVRAAIPGLRAVHGVGGNTPWPDYEAFAAAAPADALTLPVEPEDVAALLYTSGTTSLPKGVMLTHANYLADFANAVDVLQIHKDIVNVQISPLYHAAAQHTYLQIYGGGRTILLPKFDPGHLLALIEQEQVNYMFVVPTMLYNVMDHPDFETADTSRIQTISYGAAPMTEARRQEAIAKFGHIFVHAYGLTECTAHGTVLDRVSHRSKGGSIGRGLPDSEVIVVDDAGERVAPEGSGEIWIRGPHVMKGYWNRPDATEEALAGGWLHTGDIGTWDEEGFVRVIDRKKDIIISGGANIYPKDVEEVVARHPAVAEVAVYGIPHPNWGEAVEAAIVCKRGQSVSAEEIGGFAREHLAGYKVPRSIRFLEALPRNPSGKILKRELRAEATGN